MIFDTDNGNHLDDPLAIGEIHALESRGDSHL